MLFIKCFKFEEENLIFLLIWKFDSLFLYLNQKDTSNFYIICNIDSLNFVSAVFAIKKFQKSYQPKERMIWKLFFVASSWIYLFIHAFNLVKPLFSCDMNYLIFWLIWKFDYLSLYLHQKNTSNFDIICNIDSWNFVSIVFAIRKFQKL